MKWGMQLEWDEDGVGDGEEDAMGSSRPAQLHTFGQCRKQSKPSGLPVHLNKGDEISGDGGD